MTVIVPRHVEEALAQAGERHGGRAFVFSSEGVAVVGNDDGARPVVMQWLTQCDLLVANVELCPLRSLAGPEVMRYCLELPLLLPAFAGMSFVADEEEGKLFLTATLSRDMVNMESVSLLALRMAQASGSLPGELWQDGQLSDEAIDDLLALGSGESLAGSGDYGTSVDWNERAGALLREVVTKTGAPMPEIPALDELELEVGENGAPLTVSFLLDSGIGLLIASVDVQDAPAADDAAAWQKLLTVPNKDGLVAHLSISVDPFLERVVLSAPCYLVNLGTEALAMQLNRLSHAARNFSALANPEPTPAFPLHQSV